MRSRPIITVVMSATLVATGLLTGLPHPAPLAAQTVRETPYWASIAQPVARMRKGPSTRVPAIWDYRREDLPVKVLEIYQSWRKVQDPDGTVGWMAVRLLSAQRTGYVTGGIRAMHAEPDASSPIAWRAEPGVAGADARTLTPCHSAQG